jgi:lipid-binding SYLF domain-containing protein
MEGGSLGFQIGASEMDIVTLVMNENGMRRPLQSTFTLGAKHGRNSIMVPISRSL